MNNQDGRWFEIGSLSLILPICLGLLKTSVQALQSSSAVRPEISITHPVNGSADKDGVGFLPPTGAETFVPSGSYPNQQGYGSSSSSSVHGSTNQAEDRWVNRPATPFQGDSMGGSGAIPAGSSYNSSARIERDTIPVYSAPATNTLQGNSSQGSSSQISSQPIIVLPYVPPTSSTPPVSGDPTPPTAGDPTPPAAGDPTPPTPVENGKDAAAPTASLTAPAQGSTVSGLATLIAAATDDVAVARVEFYVDDKLVSTDSTAPYEVLWDTRTAIDGVHALQAKAYDSSGKTGNSSLMSITVRNGRPPVLNPIGSQAVDEDQLLSFTVSASDPDGDSLSYSASNLPQGATFDAASQNFSWQPTFTQAGTYGGVRFTVSDGSLTTSEEITITVKNVNRSPVLSPMGEKIVTVGFLLSMKLSATDPDGDALNFSAANLPSGASLDKSTGLFTWAPKSSQVGDYTVSFTVADGVLPDSQGGGNVAAGAKGASSSAYAGYGEPRAADGLYGDEAFGWVGGNADGSGDWLRLDLGGIKEIDRIVYDTRYGPDYLTTIHQSAFKIWGSLDGLNWFPLLEKSGLTSSQIFDLAIDPVKVQYVKVFGIQSVYNGFPSWHYAYVSELALFEKTGSGQQTQTLTASQRVGITVNVVENYFSVDGVDAGTRTLDLNGDGLPDLLRAAWWNGTLYKSVYINVGTGFKRDDSWVAALPNGPPYSAFSFNGTDAGMRIVDLNNDGRPDLLQSLYWYGTLYKSAFINTGSGLVRDDSWVADLKGEGSSWDQFSWNGSDSGMRVMDLNGDGLPDLLQSVYWGVTTYKTALINTGSGFKRDDSWVANLKAPGDGWNQFSWNGVDAGMRITDLNGDRLPDLLQSIYWYGTLYQSAFINTGRGLESHPEWVVALGINGEPYPQFRWNETYDSGMRIVDLNNDGKPDLLQAGWWGGAARKSSFINTGSGFVRDDSWVAALPNVPYSSAFVWDNKDAGMRVMDLNGDGTPDLMQVLWWGGVLYRSAYLNTRGGGFTRDDIWVEALPNGPPYSAFSLDGSDFGMRAMDLNGDRLPDLLHGVWWSGTTYRSTHFNTGRGFKRYDA